MSTTSSSSTRKTLRRAGTVSAGTLALVLSGGGMAFAGLLPSPTDAAIGTVTGTVTGVTSGSATASPTDTLTSTTTAVTSTVTGSSTGSDTTPAPTGSPLPEPIGGAVDSVVDTVTDTVQPVLDALAPVTGQIPPGTLPDNPITDPGPQQGTPPTAKLPAASGIPATHGAASGGGPATPTDLTLPSSGFDLTGWTAPSAADLGMLPSVATMPELPTEQQAQLAAGITPQVAGDDRIGIPHGSGSGLPGIVIIAATIAVGVVAAGHVALFQQRLAAVTTS